MLNCKFASVYSVCCFFDVNLQSALSKKFENITVFTAVNLAGLLVRIGFGLRPTAAWV